MTNWEELNMFLEKRNYINRWNVLFNQVKPGFMFVEAGWPAYDGDEDIFLVFLCDDANQFFEKLQIENASQLDQVKAEDLLSLFNDGHAQLVCAIDPDIDSDESLVFKRNGQKIFISIDGRSDVSVEISEELITSEDFIAYTKMFLDAFNEIKESDSKALKLNSSASSQKSS